MNLFDNKNTEAFVPQYLYLELHPVEPGPKENQKTNEEKEDEKRGVVIIDIF